MKVLLIQLYSEKKTEPIYPLGLSFLVNALSAHDVKIFDQNICSNDLFLETEKTVLGFFPDVVGILRWLNKYKRLRLALKLFRDKTLHQKSK